MLKKIIILTSLILIGSCGPYWYKPHGSIFKQMPKNGTPGYRLGWKHGCESGLGTQFGGAFYMTFYTWHKDIDIIKANPSNEDIDRIRRRYPKELAEVDWNDIENIRKNFSDYKNIFWTGHVFCRQSILGQLHNASMNPPIPSDKRVNFEQIDIGNVYKIDGKGDGRWGNGYW